MIYFIIYISAIITTLSVIGFIYQRSVITDLNRQLELLGKSNKKSYEPDKRLATYNWDGWHKKNDPTKTWSVTLELREVALSEDESKSKFEVISAFSENMDNDTWATKEYTEYFMKKTGGGWLDTKKNNNELTWITTVSKSESRQRKIDEILNADNNE